MWTPPYPADRVRSPVIALTLLQARVLWIIMSERFRSARYTPTL